MERGATTHYWKNWEPLYPDWTDWGAAHLLDGRPALMPAYDWQGPVDRSRGAAVLRHLREARGLTQYRVGKLAGFAAGTLNRFESGVRRPSPTSLGIIAGILRLSRAERTELFVEFGYVPDPDWAARMLAASRDEKAVAA